MCVRTSHHDCGCVARDALMQSWRYVRLPKQAHGASAFCTPLTTGGASATFMLATLAVTQPPLRPHLLEVDECPTDGGRRRSGCNICLGPCGPRCCNQRSSLTDPPGSLYVSVPC